MPLIDDLLQNLEDRQQICMTLMYSSFSCLGSAQQEMVSQIRNLSADNNDLNASLVMTICIYLLEFLKWLQV